MAVVFDGSTNYLQRSTGLFKVDTTKTILFETWILISGGDGTARTILQAKDGSNTYLEISLDASNQFDVLGANASGTTVLQTTSSAAYVAGTTWRHLAFSVSLPAAGQMYVNRADVSTDTTSDDDTIALASAITWTVGARGDATQKFTGEIYDLALWTESLDLSVAANLRKLVSSDGQTNYANPGPTSGTPKPVGYGAGAGDPTGGIPPFIYFSGPFAPNRGTGGAFATNGNFDTSRGPAHYRQHAIRSTPGERWFDSERSGFSFPRSETFIEDREGIPSFGKRLGLTERDGTTRQERPSQSFSRLLRGDNEDDAEEDRR